MTSYWTRLVTICEYFSYIGIYIYIYIYISRLPSPILCPLTPGPTDGPKPDGPTAPAVGHYGSGAPPRPRGTALGPSGAARLIPGQWHYLLMGLFPALSGNVVLNVLAIFQRFHGANVPNNDASHISNDSLNDVPSAVLNKIAQKMYLRQNRLFPHSAHLLLFTGWRSRMNCLWPRYRAQ